MACSFQRCILEKTIQTKENSFLTKNNRTERVGLKVYIIMEKPTKNYFEITFLI